MGNITYIYEHFILQMGSPKHLSLYLAVPLLLPQANLVRGKPLWRVVSPQQHTVVLATKSAHFTVQYSMFNILKNALIAIVIFF